MNNNDDYEDVASNIYMQAMIVRTFYDIDKSLIIPNIYKYLPKNWESIKLDISEDEYESLNLEEKMFYNFKEYIVKVFNMKF